AGLGRGASPLPRRSRKSHPRHHPVDLELPHEPASLAFDSWSGRQVPALRPKMKPTLCGAFAHAAFSSLAIFAKDPAPPSADRPWAPPRLGDYERELSGRSAREKGYGSHTAVDLGRIYTLPELIDLAQRNNPETRVAWERARMAAAGIGLSESRYYPYLAASAGA